MESSVECRKRSCDEPIIETKRPRYTWYFRLESESSSASQEDTESVHSIQNQETDVARDTSDTDTKSLCSDDSDLEVDLEYEVASDIDSDNPLCDSSSGTDDALAAVGAITVAICDSSYEAWATGDEDSDSSSAVALLESTPLHRGDFWTCAQCKSQNNDPRFQFCDRCYQVRKSFFPPRPKRRRKPKTKRQEENPVKLESLRSCLNGLSQDSGLGSSQEFPSLQLEQIVVPPHLTSEAGGSSSTSSSSGNVPDTITRNKRKRQFSESSLSEFEEYNKKAKLKKTVDVEKDNSKVECSIVEKNEKSTVVSEEKKDSVENKELCIMCNINPQNGIFIHGNIAHMCSCYKCAIRSWGINKRCPLCNCKARNVLKLFRCKV